MDSARADGGQPNEGALLGRPSGLLDRRSFLVGSAMSLGALGLAGCATTSDYMSLAEASKLYGPMPEEKFPIPATDISKLDPNSIAARLPTTRRKPPARSWSIPRTSTSIASTAMDPPLAP